MHSIFSLCVVALMIKVSFVDGHYVRVGNYKAATNPYYSKSGWVTCESLCDTGYLCNGYSIDASNNLCYLSSCTNYTSVPACSFCFFAIKNPTTSPDLCFTPSTTTPTSTTPTTTTSTTKSTLTTTMTPTASEPSTNDITIIVINTTSCICTCTEGYQTLEESIENRRKELTVNQLKLSSTTRKHTSAPDIRVTSKVIGTVAIIILVGFGLVFIFGDIISVFFLFEKTNINTLSKLD